MELLEIIDVAERLRLPASVVRFYRDRFILYVPCVRIGRRLHYPSEAIAVIAAIDHAVRAGASLDEIEQSLQERFPVTVITAQPIDPGQATARSTVALDALRDAMTELSATLQAEFGQVHEAVHRLASAEQVQALCTEIATLATNLASDDTRLDHASATLAAELRQELARLRQTLVDLLAEARTDRERWQALPASQAGGSAGSSDPFAPPFDAGTADADRRSRRVPRRLGQPLRANGSNLP